MAYVLPDFNLTCGIFSPGTVGGAPRLTSDCNLAFGRRVQTGISLGDLSFESSGGMYLLLPPLTDIRGELSGVGADAVEVPLGSGRWYQVYYVDDIGKGFPNEHRCAVIFQSVFPPVVTTWPVPIP